MGGKKRFGVSIPEELAGFLEDYAKQHSATRSEIVETALREYLYKHRPCGGQETCIGLILLKNAPEAVEKLVEDYRDIVVHYTHIHYKSLCLKLLVVEGSEEEVHRLRESLEAIGCKHHYIRL